MADRIIRELVPIADATTIVANDPDDAGSIPLAQSGRLTHVSVVAADEAQLPIWVTVVVDIENKGMFLVEGWVRGLTRTGGGIRWDGSMHLTRRGTNWLAIFARNDTGGAVTYVVQAIVED